jgi:hypothetical protein
LPCSILVTKASSSFRDFSNASVSCCFLAIA